MKAACSCWDLFELPVTIIGLPDDQRHDRLLSKHHYPSRAPYDDVAYVQLSVELQYLPPAVTQVAS